VRSLHPPSSSSSASPSHLPLPPTATRTTNDPVSLSHLDRPPAASVATSPSAQDTKQPRHKQPTTDQSTSPQSPTAAATPSGPRRWSSIASPCLLSHPVCLRPPHHTTLSPPNISIPLAITTTNSPNLASCLDPPLQSHLPPLRPCRSL
jgi:hypothetical protein